jgi:hypothetical protein
MYQKCNPGKRPGKNDKSDKAGNLPGKGSGTAQKHTANLGCWHGKKG